MVQEALSWHVTPVAHTISQHVFNYIILHSMNLRIAHLKTNFKLLIMSSVSNQLLYTDETLGFTVSVDLLLTLPSLPQNRLFRGLQGALYRVICCDGWVKQSFHSFVNSDSGELIRGHVKLFVRCPCSGDRTKWYWTKWYWTKWYGQNGTDKIVAIFIDSNSTELNFYSVTTSHK